MEGTATLREMLSRDHSRLDALFGELLEALRAEAWLDADRCFGVLDDELSAHLIAEEAHVLPAFAQVDAPEARALREEHDEIRRRLREIGVGMELHAVPEAVATGFIESMRAHARREDALMYRWIDAHLAAVAAGELRRGLFRRVTRRLRRKP